MTTQKPNKLAEAFSKTTATETQTVPQPKAEGYKPTSREGKKTTIAYIDPAGARELKMLALDTGRSQQDLLVEAINDLLIKHGKKPLA
jgi:hypothetical protein